MRTRTKSSANGAAARKRLSPTFWERFAREHWEKQPLLLQQPFATPFLGADETFRALVAASDEYRAGNESSSPAFYIDYAEQIADRARYLPVSRDRTAAGYAERVTRLIDGRRFALIVQHIQAQSAPIWQRLREFLFGLYECTGIPGEGAKATVFFGNYEKTPLGLHEGESSNFKFVIEGRKVMRLWRGGFFLEKKNVMHSSEYERFLDAAITLEGQPGDVIYWPSDCWHVGEPVGGLAMSLSVALYVHERPSVQKDLWRYVIDKAEDRLEKSKHRWRRRGGWMGNAAFPKLVERAARAFSDALQDAQLEQTLKVTWLNRATAFAFAVVPPPLPPETLQDDRLIRGDSRYPILWLPGAAGEIICSSGGHAFSVAAHPKILDLLRHLNTGNTSSVRALTARSAGRARRNGFAFEATPEDVRTLLEKLRTLRALTNVVPPNDGAKPGKTHPLAASARSRTQTERKEVTIISCQKPARKPQRSEWK